MARKTRQNRLTNPELTKQINPENIQLKQDFLDYLRSIQRSEGTIRGYDNDLTIAFTYILQHCGNKPFVELKKREVVMLQNWLINENGNSAARVRRIKAALSSLSNYIENILDDEYEDFRPIIRKIENPANTPVREKSVFSTEEMEQVMQKLVSDGKYQLACALALAVYSGRRKAELARFKVSWFTPENVVYDYFYCTPEKVLTKGAKQLNCYIIRDGFDPYLKLWVEQRKALKVNSDWLFVTRDGDTYEQATGDTFNSWAKTIDRYTMKVCGKPFYWHSMRHLFVSDLIRDGMAESDIVEVIGWSDSSMMQVYNDVPMSERLSSFFAAKKEREEHGE